MPPHPPAYVFLVDTCVSEDELGACKAAILQALQTLPDYAHVGLVTFGTHVHVYELGFTECTKCFVFRGSKEYTSQQIVDQLGLRAPQTQQRAGGAPAPLPAPARRFLMPLSECEFNITTALEELQKDSYPVVSTQRPARCTGTAMQVRQPLVCAHGLACIHTCMHGLGCPAGVPVGGNGCCMT